MMTVNALFCGIFMNFQGGKAMAVIFQNTVMPSQIRVLTNPAICLGIAKEGTFLHTSPPLTHHLARRKQYQI
jgi:hypothetical protein